MTKTYTLTVTDPSALIQIIRDLYLAGAQYETRQTTHNGQQAVLIVVTEQVQR